MGGNRLSEVRFVSFPLGALSREVQLERCRQILKSAPQVTFPRTGRATSDPQASTGARRSFLYLCGTERLARWVERELARRSGGAALTGNVLTLSQLQGRYTPHGAAASDMEVQLRVWAELRASKPGATPGAPGPGGTLSFASQLIELWDLLRTQGSVDDPITGPSGLADLLAPVLAVEKALGEEGRKDLTSHQRELPARVLAAPPLLDCLVVDGFEGFPPLLASIVDALASRAEEAWVLAEGDCLHPPTWTSAAPVTAPPTRAKTPPPPRAVPSSVLERWVERDEPVEGPPLVPGLKLLTGLGGEREEVESLAGEIRAILSSDPTATILLALPALPTYAPRIREVLPRFGLRPEVLFPRSLLASPPAQPIRRLLELLLAGLPHAGMMELIEDLESLGTLPAFFPGGVTAESIDRVTREARCFRGREAFTAQMRAHAKELRKEGSAAEADLSERIAQGFEGLLGQIVPLEEPRTPVDFARALSEVLDHLGFGKSPEADGLEEVLGVLDEAARALGGGSAKWSFSHLRQLVEIALALSQESVPARLPGIPVTGLHDAGLLDVDYVIVGGLSERNIPADRPSPLLSSTVRAGCGLPSGEELVHRERVRLARVLAHARKGVLLSYPSRAGDEEVLPSVLLNDLLAVARPAPSGPAGESPVRAFAQAQAMEGTVRGLTSGDPGMAASAEELLRAELVGPRAPAWRSMLRGVRVERERRDAPRLTAHDGPAGGEAARTLARRRFSSSRFSVNDVQNYLRCPYRFYLDRVLRLSSVEEVTDEVDRPALGSEVHRALYELQESTRGSDGRLGPFTEEALEREAPKFERSIREFLGTLRPRTAEVETLSRRWLGPPGRPEEGALRALLERLHEDDQEVRVDRIELPFDDRPPRPGEAVDPGPRLAPLPLGTVGEAHPVLVGRIDRLAFSRSRPAGLVIDDFKTGRSRPKDQDAAREGVPSGLELQLPLYMAAALHGLRQADPSIFPYGMRYHWLSTRAETGPVDFLRAPRNAKDEHRQSERAVAFVELALRHAANATQGILEGRFPVNGTFTGMDGGCQFASYCDHARGCRFSVVRFSQQGPP